MLSPNVGFLAAILLSPVLVFGFENYYVEKSVSLLGEASADVAESDFSDWEKINEGPGDDPLSKFLYGIEIPLGEINQTVLGTKLKVENLTCTKIVVDGLTSSITDPENIHVDVKTLGLQCRGNYIIDPVLFWESKGTIEFQAGTSANIELDISKDFTRHPIIEITPSCKFHISIQSLQIYGDGFLSKVLELLQGLLKHILPLFLNGQLCDMAKSFVSKDFSPLLEYFYEQLILPPPPHPATPTLPGDTLDLEESVLANVSSNAEQLFGPNGTFSVSSLVDLITKGTGVLEIGNLNVTVGPVQVNGLDVYIDLHSVSLDGLESTVLQHILSPTSSYYINSGLHSDNISIEANATLRVLSDTAPLVEPFMFRSDAHNINLGLSMLTAVSPGELFNTTLYHSLLPQCWNNFMYSFNVSYVNASFAPDSLSITPLVEGGVLEEALAVLGNDIISKIFLTDKEFIPSAVQRIANVYLVPMLRNIDLGICPAAYGGKLLSWDNLALLDLTKLVTDSSLNTLIRNTVGGDISIPLNLTEQASISGVIGKLHVNYVNISGLDTFYDTVLLEASGPRYIETRIGVGEESPLVVAVSLTVTVNGQLLLDLKLNETINKFHVSMLEDIAIEDSFLNSTISQVIEWIPQSVGLGNAGLSNSALQATECFLSGYVDTLNFSLPDLTVQNLTSKLYYNGEWLNLEEALDHVSPTLAEVLNDFTKILPATLQSTVNRQLDKAVRQSPYYCRGVEPPSGEGSKKSDLSSWQIALCVIGPTWIAIFVAGILGWKCCCNRQQKEENENLLEDPNVEEQKGEPVVPDLSRRVSMFADGTYHSLADYYPWKSKFGAALQICIPLLITVTTGVKIAALITNVVRVKLNLHLTSGSNLIDMYIIDFTFANMVEYFWKSKAYLISILIVLGSCVLPLLFSVALYIVWYIPLKPSHRGRILLSFAQVGKGSYIDVMFLCYIILVIKQKIDLGGMTGSLTAVPVEGIFMGIASTTSNLLLCIFLWHLHNTKMEKKDHPSNRQYNLWQLHTRQIGREEARSWTSCFQFASVVVLFLVSAAALVAVIFNSDISWFRLTGIVEEVGEFDRHDVIRTYNLYSFPPDLPSNTDTDSGAYTISFIYSVLVLAVPLALLLCWMVLWLVPLKKQVQRNLYTTVYRLFCFSGLEVFWIATLAAVLEIDMVCVWILNHTIDGWCSDYNIEALCDVYNELKLSSKILHIDSKFLDGGWWLLAEWILFLAMHNATLYFGGMILGHTSRKGNWTRPPSRMQSKLYSQIPIRRATTERDEKKGANSRGSCVF